MLDLSTGATRRALAPFAAAMAFGLVACGSSDDDATSSKASADPTTTAAPSKEPDRDAAGSGRRGDDSGGPEGTSPAPPDGAGDPGAAQPDPGGESKPPPEESDESAVAALAAGMYDAFAERDAATVCSRLTAAARAEFVRQRRSTSSCTDTLADYFASLGANDLFRQFARTTVTDVKIDGDVAIVTIRLGRQTANTRLVLENDRWRFGSLLPKQGASETWN
jgi:hypothetical protein